MSSALRKKALGGVVTACSAALVLTSLAPLQAVGDPAGHAELIREADEQTSVVEVVLADTAELDRLVDTGADLDHGVHPNEDGTLTVHAVVTPSEQANLQARGFRIGGTVHSDSDTEAVVAEREATLAAARAENESFAAAAADGSVADVKVIRADYYESYGVGYLSVEAK